MEKLSERWRSDWASGWLMATPATTPRDINPTEDGTALQITWEDGHESIYQPFDLRMSCPCASCVDEISGRRTLTEAMVPPGVYPTAIHYVGRYALKFVWSDGHDTGLYSFDLLRGLCGCAKCSAVADNSMPEEDR